MFHVKRGAWFHVKRAVTPVPRARRSPSHDVMTATPRGRRARLASPDDVGLYGGAPTPTGGMTR